MFEIGSNVELKAYDGQRIVRRVVDRRKETLYVCTEEEYEKARNQKRDPVCVGFNMRYVLGNG